MSRSSIFPAAVLVALTVIVSCGGCNRSPTAPTGVDALPLSGESDHFRYFHAPGVDVEITRQEAFHTWAVARLGVSVPRKIDYRRYTSRNDMGQHTGKYNTNGYAEPELFTIHTLWSWDNHETVHIYSALIGRPSDFFNEGLAVAMQTDPLAGDFEPRFNGEQVHAAAKRYRAAGSLVLPLSQIATTTGFRGILDSTLSYREAGSFVAFLIDRYGMASVQQFFRISTASDSQGTIRTRFQQAFGASLEDAEAAWLAFVG